MVKVLDADGSEVPRGQLGDIYVWNPGAGDFTYHGRDRDRAAIETDGLVTLGDVGYLDDDDFLYLCGRSKDMIISGGVNIYPAEIEAALIQHPDVADCAVFASRTTSSVSRWRRRCSCAKPGPTMPTASAHF
jgi:long-chain acyl-CoA synthetase